MTAHIIDAEPALEGIQQAGSLELSPEISAVLLVSVQSRKPARFNFSSASGTSGCAGIEANFSVSSARSAALIEMPQVVATIFRTAPPMSVNGT